jgi:hypothetical protein
MSEFPVSQKVRNPSMSANPIKSAQTLFVDRHLAILWWMAKGLMVGYSTRRFYSVPCDFPGCIPPFRDWLVLLRDVRFILDHRWIVEEKAALLYGCHSGSWELPLSSSAKFS